MLDPITGLLTNIYDAMKGNFWLALMVIAIAFVGYKWITDDHQGATRSARWVLIGGAVVLGAPRIAAAIEGAIH